MGLKSASPAAANGEAQQDFPNNAPPHSETTPSAQAELRSGLVFDGRPSRDLFRALRQTVKYAPRAAGLRCLSAEQDRGGES
jgi:hypothetical protein